jgi:hypothetical protein
MSFLRRNPLLADVVVGALLGLPGVFDVRSNAACGSLIVCYDPAPITLEALLARCDPLPTPPSRTRSERAQRLLTPGAGLLAFGVINSAQRQHGTVSPGPVWVRSLEPLDVVELLAAAVRRDWRSLLVSLAFLFAAEALRQPLRQRSRTPGTPWPPRAPAHESLVLVGAVAAARPG